MSERFATTQWSLVLAARDGTEGEARQAPRTVRLGIKLSF
jgi:hypothetical protein